MTTHHTQGQLAPTPDPFVPDGDCYTGKGEEYYGTYSTTRSLRQCIPWPSETYTIELLEGGSPKVGSNGEQRAAFGMEGLHNFCR